MCKFESILMHLKLFSLLNRLWYVQSLAASVPYFSKRTSLKTSQVQVGKVFDLNYNKLFNFCLTLTEKFTLSCFLSYREKKACL